MTTILWLRQDLRLTDHPALVHAAAAGAVLPVYIRETEAAWPMGAASRWWLHGALAGLAESFEKLGAPLVLRTGAPLDVLRGLCKETGARQVVWSRRYEPSARAQEAHIKQALQAEGLEVQSFNAALLFEPWEIQSKTGGPYKVYTPFAKACFAAPPPPVPLKAPRAVKGVSGVRSEKLEDWALRPTQPDWAKDMAAQWQIGEKPAQERLKAFMAGALAAYSRGRDRPDQDGTSKLSPYLHFGHISPRQIWHAVQHASAAHSETAAGAQVYLKELLWREFSVHLLHHFPQLPEKPLQSAFAKFPWRRSGADLRAWQKGQTGYPIVDAGLRQLWREGWMHNRVRMIVGSFLVKDLLLSWREGEDWFWDTLLDADLASNAASWQWIGGCGADAAPYFRVFNPVLQGQKFDPEGAYVRRYVPELAALKGPQIHAPWELDASTLRAAGVVLGKTYPHPLVDHKQARLRALEALKKTH